MKPILSPKELAIAIDASESSIKRWVDAGKIPAEKTGGGHRKIYLNDAMRFIRDNNHALCNGTVLGFPEIDTVLPEMRENLPHDRLFTYLEEGNAEKATGYLLSLYFQGESFAAICDGPIQQAMAKIGEMWREQNNGICIEHHATDVCIQAINRVRRIFTPPPDAPRMLGGAPSGDPYFIPSLLACTVLMAEGFQTINLGPNTPFETFQHAIDRHNPILVWLSISVNTNSKALRNGIENLAEYAGNHGAQLIVGGTAARFLAKINLPNVFLGSSMTELAAFSRGMLAQV
ncbi:hypothetical protein GF373_08685 [bacterium]|nr:hypothetical protein [bacterium]